MRWTPGGRSSDLEDRRGSGGGFGGGGMRIGLGGAAVLLVLSLIFKQNFFALVGADGQGGEPTASGPVATTPEEEKRVVMGLYNRYCIRCHGVDGRGVWDIPGVPNFTDTVWQSSRSDAQIVRIIVEGRPRVRSESARGRRSFI